MSPAYLIMHLDLDDMIKKHYLEKVLNISDITMKRKNVGSEKFYKEAYKQFTNSTSLPDEYLTQMLDSKYARHFFDENELNKLKMKMGSKPYSISK